MGEFFSDHDPRRSFRGKSVFQNISEKVLENPWKACLFLGVLLAVGLIFYFFIGGRSSLDSKNIPVIKALPGSSRLRPSEEKESLVPHQDREIYQNIEKTKEKSTSPKVEHLLPPVEAPLSFEQKEESLSDEEDEGENNFPVEEEGEVGTEVSQQKDSTNGEEKSLEEKAPAPSLQNIDQLLGQSLEGKDKEVSSEVSPEKIFQKGGKYRLQLASLPTRETAEQEWKRIQNVMKKDPLVRRLKPTFERIDLGAQKGGIIYRITVGGIASRESAKILKDRLKQRKIDCLVIAP